MRWLFTLLRLHFAGSAVNRAASLAGGAMTAIGIAGLLRFPQLLFVGRDYHFSNATIAFSAVLGLVPLFGIVTLFLGGGMMPVILVHLTRGRLLMLLPGGRRRLLASCLAVLLLVACAFSAVMQALYISFPLDMREVLGKAFIISFLMFAMLYALLWLVSRAKSALMILSGTMLLLPCLLLPFRYVQVPSSSIRAPLIAGSIGIILGATLYLAWPKDRRLMLPTGRIRLRALAGRTIPEQAALATYLRLPHPVIVALAQAIPLGIASIYITAPNLWLFYFVLCSMMSGTAASRAASRTRALWLKLSGNRENLYLKVESTFWLYNAYAISALVVLLTVLGSLRDLGTELMAIGIPLLVIGFAVGLYLGLMMTGRLRVSDAMAAVASTGLMLGLAYYADTASAAFVAISLILLAAAALAFRVVSRHRWQLLDWAENRPERQA